MIYPKHISSKINFQNPYFFYCLIAIILLLSAINFTLYLTEADKKISLQQNNVLGAETENSLDKEKAFWENFLSLHPNYFPGLFEIAKIQYSSGDYQNFLKTLGKMEKINPNSEFINYLKGQ